MQKITPFEKGMEYFTAEEAIWIVGKTPVRLVAFQNNNSNPDAICAITAKAERGPFQRYI